MSQEIIATTARGTLARPDDAWVTGANTALTTFRPQPVRPSPLKIVHRLLRGRVLLAVILSFAGLIAGGIYGWTSTTPKFTSEGLLEVKPYVLRPDAVERGLPHFTNFVRSQPAKISNARTVSAALNRDEWKSVSSRPATQEFAGTFLGNLSVDYVRETFILKVTFDDSDPVVARGAVDAVMRAYVDISKENDTAGRVEQLNRFEDMYNKADTEFRRLQDTIRNLSADFGTDKLEALMEARQKALLEAEKVWNDSQSQLDLATANKTVDGRNMPELTPNDLAGADEMMRYFIEARAKALFTLVRLSNELGTNHPNVQRASRDYEMSDRMLNEYFENNKQRFSDVRPDLDGNGQLVITPKLIEQIKQVVEVRRKRYEQESAAAKKLAVRMTEIRVVRDELDRATLDRDSREKAKESLEFQLAGTGQIAITSEATQPVSPSKDRRKQFAAIAGLAGGALPVGLLMLIGLLDSRYRYSEEATESELSTNLTLLGILPNLPDRLSDPGQASIAAHCVHQVRTRLQIDAPVDGPVAYSVTSASSGDGKTSLTLALGLSFAASGSRTLLIDCDLVGAGLTARLNMTGPKGILDAVTTRNVMQFVRNTDVSDLAMLPAGNAQLQHAGVFSPAAMKRLINDARKHFEVILIDTGPILGSIEATPVCSAVDGVILTVARGQQRPLVEKALSHLKSIGARIAGVVFNRAQARDFEQSISGISLRSAARSQNGHGSNGYREAPSGQYGSLAKAVASSTARQQDSES